MTEESLLGARAKPEWWGASGSCRMYGWPDKIILLTNGKVERIQIRLIEAERAAQIRATAEVYAVKVVRVLSDDEVILTVEDSTKLSDASKTMLLDPEVRQIGTVKIGQQLYTKGLKDCVDDSQFIIKAAPDGYFQYNGSRIRKFTLYGAKKI